MSNAKQHLENTDITNNIWQPAKDAIHNIHLDAYSPYHKTGHTSKGDQLKWRINDMWYKADYMGYESLSEVLVSRLLHKSSLKEPFVTYYPVEIDYSGQTFQGCASPHFLSPTQMLIPLEKLYRQYTGQSLAKKLTEFSQIHERIQYLVNQIEAITQLKHFGAYITAMLEIDAFFLNEDRHTNNIAVIYDEQTQTYACSPLFDQGLCLFADTKLDYPLTLSAEQCLEKIEAKPFSNNFDTQLDAAEELYGIQLHFHFTMKDIEDELASVGIFYPQAVYKRVEDLLRIQFRKYAYLIEN